jgi:hypothetical protein
MRIKMNITVNGRRSSSRCCIIALAVLSHGNLNAQQNAKAPSKVQPITTVAQLLALSAAANPNTIIAYLDASRVLNALPAAERKTVHDQLIAGPHTGLASLAARRAIDEGDTDSAALIASHISSWPHADQGAILQNLGPTARVPYLEIPRAVVRSAIKTPKAVSSPDSPTEHVGIAAILLAKTGNPADRQMLLELTQPQPRSWGVWMAIAYAGGVDSTRAGLASVVYKDTNERIAVRVAAASALETLDSQAGAFAVSKVQSFLTRFGNQSAVQIYYDGSPDKPSDDARQRFFDFRFNFHLLGALLVLKNNAAQQLTFQYLNANNEMIRELCGIVAALRWPDQFVKAGRGSFPDREYDHLLAVVALNHPEQANAASVRITPDRMAKAKSDIGKIGLGVFGLPGNMLIVF